MNRLEITVLVENQPAGRGLLGEHGIAFHVQADGRALLFDTGQGLTLGHNAAALGLDLARVEAIVLSHGHYDHTGGLPAILDVCDGIDVYLHPQALQPKFNREGKDIGIPPHALTALKRGAVLHTTDRPTEVLPGVFVTGPIPRRHAFEDSGGPFFCDAECAQEDMLLDDQAMYAFTPQGVVVLLGCCHAGVVNTLEYIVELAGASPIHAVIGGTHLLRANEERLKYTASVFELLDVQLIAANHCTGLYAQCFLRTRFPARFHEAPAGRCFVFAADV